MTSDFLNNLEIGLGALLKEHGGTKDLEGIKIISGDRNEFRRKIPELGQYHC